MENRYPNDRQYTYTDDEGEVCTFNTLGEMVDYLVRMERVGFHNN